MLTPTRRHAVIFDLDGTLIDSLPDLRTALNHLLEAEGRKSLRPEDVRLMVGDGAMRLVERAFLATGPAPHDLGLMTRRFLGYYQGHAAEATRVYPGVVETLSALTEAGWRLGICTNKPHAHTLEALHGLGLAGFFGAVLGGDSLAVKKPDPRPLLATAEALGAAPGQAVMVGDSGNDVQAARAAGLPVIAVTFGYSRVPVRELGADMLIDDFASLPQALQKVT